MRVIQEIPYYTTPYNKYENDEFLNNIIRDREIGLLGKECRFIVQTVSTFASKVYNFSFDPFFIELEISSL